MVDQWEKYLDLMVDSVLVNSGRSCISCSGIWASRHTNEIAEALAKRMGPVAVKPPDDATAELAAFTVPDQAVQIQALIEQEVKENGVTEVSAKYRGGPRLIQKDRCAYLRPTVVHCDSPAAAIAKKEYMFPFVTVVKCPQDQILDSIGPTLVCTAITEDPKMQRAFADGTHIDRLNLGAIPTIQLNWLQPHEGSIVDFLFRARALQKT
jgi:acyl-CoA reductase-like NAD-dependent aldehyde dehydrogenase